MLVSLRHDAPKEALRFRMHEAVVVLEVFFCGTAKWQAESTMEKLLGSDVLRIYHMMGEGGNFRKVIEENISKK